MRWVSLSALKRQTLSREKWELLLIDNASSTQTAKASDLRWHPNGRHLSETKIGKTNALLLAIREAKAELLLTVDDDNILEPDYLEGCLKIASEFPKLGAWGGQIIGEFEVPPPAWAAPHLHNLALYEAAHDVWSNLPPPSSKFREF